MKDLKRNGEGYPDPTAHDALSAVLKDTPQPLKLGCFRPLVYICSPFTGDIQGNTANAQRYSRIALEKGAIPIAPHLLFPQFMDDDVPDERALAMKMSLILLTKCNELWYFGGIISAGMEAEIRRARYRGMKVRHFNETMEEEANDKYL